MEGLESKECIEALVEKNEVMAKHIIELENTIRENERQFQIQLAEQEREVSRLIQENNIIQNAVIWKCTKPLRVFIDVIKKVLRFIVPRKIRKGIYYLLHYGFKETMRVIKEGEGLIGADNKNRYQKWIKDNEKWTDVEPLEYNPLISVVIPVYNTNRKLLTECIESVLTQTYENFELCLADDASTMQETIDVLNEYESNEKVKVVYRKENGHISKSTNSALELAKGEFVAFMDCDDILAKNALYEVAYVLNKDRGLDFIYSDEDKVNEEGEDRHFPHFKPDWSPDTLMSMMYTSHLGVYRRSLVEEVGRLREGFEGAQDYDLTLRITEKTENICHIPKILYHWREGEGSTATSAEAKPYILEAQKKAKEEALARRGIKGKVEFVERAVQFRVNYEPPSDALVSIIIPSKDNPLVYERCIKSIVEKSTFKNYEIIHVDNGSNDSNKKIYESIAKEYNINYQYKVEEFNFSHMCNVGAEHSTGDYLLFLNDDTEVITEDWLERMLGQASQKKTGAVGAKLYYPGGTLIQHCGVVNILEGPSHILCQGNDSNVYEFGRNVIDFNYIAVTGACLMVSKEKFNMVNGFDEELPVAYNDIDLCFKLIEAGFFAVQRNDATLYHYESLSRGDDHEDKAKMERLNNDRLKLYNRHSAYYGYDPYYNYNNRM